MPEVSTLQDGGVILCPLNGCMISYGILSVLLANDRAAGFEICGCGFEIAVRGPSRHRSEEKIDGFRIAKLLLFEKSRSIVESEWKW